MYRISVTGRIGTESGSGYKEFREMAMNFISTKYLETYLVPSTLPRRTDDVQLRLLNPAGNIGSCECRANAKESAMLDVFRTFVLRVR